MTRQQKIDLIRQKCIEANPEIGDITTRSHHLSLAHVLLAIKEHQKKGRRFAEDDFTLVATNGRFLTWTSKWFNRANEFSSVPSKEQARNPDIIRVSADGKWNLRKDDLTEQSEETITFLAELLQ